MSLAEAVAKRRGKEWRERSLMTDPVTGLASRAAFDEFLARECARGSEPVSVLVLHVSGAATIRNRFGDGEGDRLLARAAEIVRRVTRGWEIAARYDEDDLAVVFPGMELEDALRVGRRIAHETERSNYGYGDGRPPLFFAFGAASGRGCRPEELVAAADPRRANRTPEVPVTGPGDDPDATGEGGDGPSVA